MTFPKIFKRVNSDDHIHIEEAQYQFEKWLSSLPIKSRKRILPCEHKAESIEFRKSKYGILGFKCGDCGKDLKPNWEEV